MWHHWFVTFETVVSVLVVKLLLEAVGLEEGVGGMLEAGNGVGSWRRGFQASRTKQNTRWRETFIIILTVAT